MPAAQFSAGAEGSAFYTTLLLFALSMIVIGNGFFKPNISTIVGALYAHGDRRRDAGFTIFYAGINIGSILGQLAVPLPRPIMSAGGPASCACPPCMLFGWALIQFDGGRLAGYGEPPATEGPDRAPLIYLLSIASVVVFWLIFRNVMDTPRGERPASSGHISSRRRCSARRCSAIFLRR